MTTAKLRFNRAGYLLITKRPCAEEREILQSQSSMRQHPLLHGGILAPKQNRWLALPSRARLFSRRRLLAGPFRFEPAKERPATAFYIPDARPQITRTDGSCANTPSVV